MSSGFDAAIVQFLGAPKRLAGEAAWRTNSQDETEQVASYGLLSNGMLLPHSLRLSAHPARTGRPFSIVVKFVGVTEPLMRVTVEPEGRGHDNRDPPHGYPASVRGARFYPCDSHNRERLLQGTGRKLLAVAVERKHHPWHNALRWFCQQAGIEVGEVMLLDYPTPGTLL